MRATRDERADFGRLLAGALEANDMSQAELRSRLQLRHGIIKSATAVSNWVSGTFAPDRKATQALDDILGTRGRLLEALGYSARLSSPLDTVTLTPDLRNWIAGLDELGRGRLLQLVQEIARTSAVETSNQVFKALGIELDPSSVVQLRNDVVHGVVVEEWPVLRLAANEGSPDPHDDQVEPATAGHPGGSDVEPAPGE